ncbi:MAG: ABC transporter substrate-binding protein [Rhodospirillales bacterium]|jgi:NitT/TauT family transport system substrate-binding protein
MKSYAKILAAFAFAAVVAGNSALAQTPLSLRLDWSVYGTHAAFYYGIDRGLYKAEGIDLSVGEGSGSGTTARLLAQGTDPVAFIDFGTLAKGIGSGMPIKAIFGVHQRSPMAIISHANAPIRTPQELEGKVIAMAPAESTAQMFPVLLSAAKLDPAKVSVLSPAAGAKVALFLQRRVDAITGVTYFHLPTFERDKVAVHYFTYGDFGVSALEGGVAANDAWLAANPELARKFVKATQTSFLAAKSNPTAAVDALIKLRPEQARNRESLIRQLQISMESTSTAATAGMPFGRMAERDWQQMVDQLVESKQVPAPIPLDRLFTNAFVGD